MTTNETTLPGPGRELDALVAQRFGWREDGFGIGMYHEPGNPIASRTVNEIPHYSTSIEAAWELVEKANGEDFHFAFNNIISFPHHKPERWSAIFRKYREDGGTAIEVRRVCNTAPHAICLAFLALGEGEGQ